MNNALNRIRPATHFLVFSLLFSACGGGDPSSTEPPPDCVDLDGDEYGVGADCLGPDCDDEDAARFVEVVAYGDRDGDGWTTGEELTLCTDGETGFASEPSDTLDCDDEDPGAQRCGVAEWFSSTPLNTPGLAVGSGSRVLLCGEFTEDTELTGVEGPIELTFVGGITDLLAASLAAESGLATWARSEGSDRVDACLGVLELPSGDGLWVGFLAPLGSETTLVIGEGDPGETTLTATDPTSYFAKYDDEGALAWAREVPEIRPLAQASDLVLARMSDGFAVGGYFEEPLTLELESGTWSRTPEGREAAVVGFDEAGDARWVAPLGTLGDRLGLAPAPSGDGVIAFDVFHGDVSFEDRDGDLIELSAGTEDDRGLALVEIDGEGEITGARVLATSENAIIVGGFDVSAEGVAVFGAFGEALTVSPGHEDETTLEGHVPPGRPLGERGMDLGFVITLDWEGRLRAAQVIEVELDPDFSGSYPSLRPVGVVAHRAGGVVVAGRLENDGDPASFVFGDGPGGAIATGSGIATRRSFIARYDEAGRLTWLRTHQGGLFEIRSLALDPAGAVLISGAIAGSPVYAPGEPEELVIESAGSGFVGRIAL